MMRRRTNLADAVPGSAGHIGMLGCVVLLAALAGCDTRDVPTEPNGTIAPDFEAGSARSEPDTNQDQERPAAETGEADELAAEQRAQSDAPASAGEDAAGADSDLGGERIAALGGGQELRAYAELEPTPGNDARGDASFVQTDSGLEIVVTMTGLSPGPHGIHVHENGDCSGDGASAAGDHFNPSGSPHGAQSAPESGRHAGDLGNIEADDSGNAELRVTDPILEIEGEVGVADRALIVHDGEDDFTTQPDGDAGDPVACGVIELRARG